MRFWCTQVLNPERHCRRLRRTVFSDNAAEGEWMIEVT
jgi:hypothetical protein